MEKIYKIEQNFNFNLKIRINYKSKNYDEAMINIIKEVNKLNLWEVIIKKIEWENKFPNYDFSL